MELSLMTGPTALTGFNGSQCCSLAACSASIIEALCILLGIPATLCRCACVWGLCRLIQSHLLILYCMTKIVVKIF